MLNRRACERALNKEMLFFKRGVEFKAFEKVFVVNSARPSIHSRLSRKFQRFKYFLLDFPGSLKMNERRLHHSLKLPSNSNIFAWVYLTSGGLSICCYIQILITTIEYYNHNSSVMLPRFSHYIPFPTYSLYDTLQMLCHPCIVWQNVASEW
jgi:hypothetical protein